MIILDRIPIFIAVAEELSFSRAAERLGRTQSAVSQSIALLEEELETKLFIRESKQIRLTEPGEILFKESCASLGHMESALLQISDWRGLKRGTLRIGISPTVGSSLLPPVIEIFCRKYQGIDLQVMEILSDNAPDALHSGIIDIAFGILPDNASHLKQILLMKRQSVLVSRDKIIPVEGDTYFEKTLGDYPFIISGTGMLSRKTADNLFSHWIKRPRILMTCSNLGIIRKMILKGLGVGILPEPFIAEDLACKDLYAIPFQQEGKIEHAGVIYSPENEKIPAVRELLQSVREYYQISKE